MVIHIITSIAPAMNVKKSTVIEAVQDVVESLFNLRNDYIKFPETEQETAAIILRSIPISRILPALLTELI